MFFCFSRNIGVRMVTTFEGVFDKCPKKETPLELRLMFWASTFWYPDFEGVFRKQDNVVKFRHGRSRFLFWIIISKTNCIYFMKEKWTELNYEKFIFSTFIKPQSMLCYIQSRFFISAKKGRTLFCSSSSVGWLF